VFYPLGATYLPFIFIVILYIYMPLVLPFFALIFQFFRRVKLLQPVPLCLSIVILLTTSLPSLDCFLFIDYLYYSNYLCLSTAKLSRSLAVLERGHIPPTSHLATTGFSSLRVFHLYSAEFCYKLTLLFTSFS
jgi:hypothetical protein